MIQNLPDDSAVSKAINGWTGVEFFLADLLDSSRFGRWEYSKSCGGEGPEPEPIPRPNQGNAKETQRSNVKAAHDQIMASLRGSSG